MEMGAKEAKEVRLIGRRWGETVVYFGNNTADDAHVSCSSCSQHTQARWIRRFLLRSAVPIRCSRSMVTLLRDIIAAFGP